MHWQRTCHTLPQTFMANSLAMEALPRFSSGRQSHGCQPQGVNSHKRQRRLIFTQLSNASLYASLRKAPLPGQGLVDILWKFRKVGKGWRLPAYVHLAQVSLACCSLHTPAIHQKLQLRSWIQIQKISPRNQRYYIGINRHIGTLDTSLNGRNVKRDVLDFQSLALISSSTCPFTERPTPLSRPHRFSLAARKHSQTMKSRKLG